MLKSLSEINLLDSGSNLITQEPCLNTLTDLFDKKINITRKTEIIDLDAPLLPVKPKPFFIDIAGEAVIYPDLSDKMQAPKKGGLWSWFGK